MPGLSVHRDILADLTTAHLTGVWTSEDAAYLGAALRALVDECPHALIVDSDTTDLPSELRSMIAAVAAEARIDIPPVAVIVCDPAARQSSGNLTSATYSDTAQRIAAVLRAQIRSAKTAFSATVDAPAHARRLVADTCTAWNLSDNRVHAQLVVSELVTNAVRHAHSGGIVELAHRPGFLHIRVEDDSAQPPTPVIPAVSLTAVHGRGLGLVGQISSAHGFRIDDNGRQKVVWSSIQIPTYQPTFVVPFR